MCLLPPMRGPGQGHPNLLLALSPSPCRFSLHSPALIWVARSGRGEQKKGWQGRVGKVIQASTEMGGRQSCW